MSHEAKSDIILLNHTSLYTGVGRYASDIIGSITQGIKNINLLFNLDQSLQGLPQGETVTGTKSIGINVALRKLIYRNIKRRLEKAKKEGSHLHYLESSMPRITESKQNELVTFHDIFPITDEDKTFKNILYRKFTNEFLQYDNAIAISNFTKESVLNFGYKGNIKVIYNMVNEEFSNIENKEGLRSRYGIPNDKKVLISVSTSIPRKNLSLLTRIMTELNEEFYLIRVGPPIGFGKTFNGIDTRTLAELYNCADTFILTSTKEGFNYPVAEAMSCGLPVVVSDIPIMREVTGEAGLFSDLDDPNSFIENVHRSIDANYYYSKKSLERSRIFSRVRFKKEMTDFYNSLF